MMHPQLLLYYYYRGADKETGIGIGMQVLRLNQISLIPTTNTTSVKYDVVSFSTSSFIHGQDGGCSETQGFFRFCKLAVLFLLISGLFAFLIKDTTLTV